jgi:penicillin-binding protein 2
VKLAWNISDKNPFEVSKRSYTTLSGFSHILGYIRYPSKDKNGFYFRKDYEGIEGIEGVYNGLLQGVSGTKILEIDALGKIQSESTVNLPWNGENIDLSIDSRIQTKLYELIASLANSSGFTGGTGALMDVNTGEIIAMTSFPEHNSQAMTDGDKKLITKFNSDSRKPFLDRFVSGLYTPGSVVKPMMAIAALSEKVIAPEKEIISTGSISLPNPYDATKKSVFNDWKAHGATDMRRAIAVSSDVYFYEIGGGFENQKGLGIANIEKYMNMFGFGIPETKTFFAKAFPGDQWRIGDTYFTAIGQYGWQATPLQILKATASVANSGIMIEPRITVASSTIESLMSRPLPIPKEYFKVAQEGMREGVVEGGTSSGLNVGYVEVASKTGTAELGSKKQFVNSLVVGFFPYKHPRYAFTIVMEKGPVKNTIGGVFIMRELLDWMNINTPEYFE